MYSRLRFDDENTKKIQQLVVGGLFHYNAAGKLVRRSMGGAWQTPWIFVAQARKKWCGYWNHIYCNMFNVIPTACRFNCWKTVIKPRTVEELFKLYELLRALNVPSKCGADVRNYTYGPWGGYVYGDTLEEGRDYYARVRKGVDKIISPDVSVILKRGCTEMERLTPSDQWDIVPPEMLDLERRLHDLFEFEETNYFQSDHLKNEIKERWVRRAIEIGDPTARAVAEMFSGDRNIWQRLVVHSLTYHESDPREALKRKRDKKGKFVKGDK